MGGAASINFDASSTRRNFLRSISEVIAAEFNTLDQKLNKEDQDGIREHFFEMLLEKERQIIQKYENHLLNAVSETEIYSEGVKIKNSKVLKKFSNTFLICCDGSQFGDAAYKSAMHLRKPIDHVILYHSYTSSQNTMTPAYKMNEVKLKYESQLIGSLTTDKYSLCFQERPEEMSKLDALTNLSRDILNHTLSGKNIPNMGSHEPDFIILGYSGRRSEIENAKVMGSATDIALRKIHIPCIIAKTVCPKDSKVYVACITNNERCRTALKILFTLVTGGTCILH